MDSEIVILEDEPLSGNTSSQNEIQFFTRYVPTNTNSDLDNDVTVLDNDCAVTVKTKIKSETSNSMTERECFTKDLVKQIKRENPCEIDSRTEIQKQTSVPSISAMRVKISHMNNTVQNSQPWRLEKKSSSVSEDDDAPQIILARIHKQPVPSDRSDKSALPPTEAPCKCTCSCKGCRSTAQSASSSQSSVSSLSSNTEANTVLVRRKIRHSRTVFTRSQLEELEKAFRKSHYLLQGVREELVSKTKLTDEQVKIWFKNRRAKLFLEEPEFRNKTVKELLEMSRASDT